MSSVFLPSRAWCQEGIFEPPAGRPRRSWGSLPAWACLHPARCVHAVRVRAALRLYTCAESRHGDPCM